MRVWLFAAAVVGCSGNTESLPPVPSPSPIPVVAEPEVRAPPEFPDGTRSLVLRRTVGVRLAPGDAAKRIGTIGIDTRVTWVQTAKARGCDKPWIEIRPRGWVCGDYVEPSTKPAFGQEVPHLDKAELVPGIYGKVTAPSSMTYRLEKPDRKDRKKDARRDARKAGPPERAPATPAQPRMVEDKPLVGSVNVRQYDEITVGGRPYWRVDRKGNEYVLKQAIALHRPSGFAGVRLGDDTGASLPIAFVWPRYGAALARTTMTAAGAGPVRQIASRTPVAILEVATDKAGAPRAYRIAGVGAAPAVPAAHGTESGPQEWLAAGDVRVFQPAPPPPLLTPGERWIDVDVDHQILVAYEGELAVYATLVSSGSTATPTEPGVYRMWLKEAEADMKGLNGEDPYSVATVPWTQFFSPENGLALHTAYWHDQFGTRRSHGCVNLAPRDARWLYFWSEPQVPPGWTMTAGMAEAPGSVVRIRNKDNPAPEAKGYAREVLEARRQNAPIMTIR